MANNRVKFLDTTLRDGEQSAGIGMTVDEKMEIAKQLERLKVDIIEAGFAASSPGDFRAVNNIAREVRGPVIASLARAHPNDVDQAWEAIKVAEFAPDSRLPVVFRDSRHAPAPQEPGRGHGYGGEHGGAGQRVLQRRGVFAHGRHPHRPGVPVPNAGGGNPRRRHHH